MSRPLGSTPTPASRDLAATTGRSASERRVGTQCLRFPPRHAPSRDHQGLRPRTTDRRSPSHVPCKSRRPGSRRLHAGHHLASSRVSARLVSEGTPGPPVSMPSERVSTPQQRTPDQVTPNRALLERLPGPHLTRSSRAVSPDAHHDSLQLTQLGVVWRLPPKADAGGPTILHLLHSSAYVRGLLHGPSFSVRDTRCGSSGVTGVDGHVTGMMWSR